MPSIFTKIIRGEIPCHKVAEDDLHIAFLDIRPVKPGHTLVIPKREVDYMFDLGDIELGNLWSFAKKVAGPVKQATQCTRVGVMVAGLEVPHTHIHLIPMDDVIELNFKYATPAKEDDLKEMAARISGFMT
jgi:histidine triad (HIT) family protein